MRNIIRLVCFLILSFTMSCAWQGKESKENFPDHAQETGTQRTEHEKSVPGGKEHPDYAPDQIIVKFRQGTDKQTVEAIQEALHLKTIQIVSGPNLYLMKILDGSSVERIMERLKDFQAVMYSEPNYILRLQ